MAINTHFFQKLRNDETMTFCLVPMVDVDETPWTRCAIQTHPQGQDDGEAPVHVPLAEPLQQGRLDHGLTSISLRERFQCGRWKAASYKKHVEGRHHLRNAQERDRAGGARRAQGDLEQA